MEGIREVLGLLFSLLGKGGARLSFSFLLVMMVWMSRGLLGEREGIEQVCVPSPSRVEALPNLLLGCEHQGEEEPGLHPLMWIHLTAELCLVLCPFILPAQCGHQSSGD